MVLFLVSLGSVSMGSVSDNYYCETTNNFGVDSENNLNKYKKGI